MFERGPDPLPTADRLVPDVETDEPKRLTQIGRLGRLVRVTRHQHQRVDGVKILPFIGRIENLPGHLDHDRAGIAARLVRSSREIDFQRGVFFTPLPGSALKIVFLNVVKHRPVHQNVEDRVVALLVDQRAGLKRLVEAFLDHLDDHHWPFSSLY